MVWLPGGASEALGTPAAWHHELGCLLQMESPEASEAGRLGPMWQSFGETGEK